MLRLDGVGTDSKNPADEGRVLLSCRVVMLRMVRRDFLRRFGAASYEPNYLKLNDQETFFELRPISATMPRRTATSSAFAFAFAALIRHERNNQDHDDKRDHRRLLLPGSWRPRRSNGMTLFVIAYE